MCVWRGGARGPPEFLCGLRMPCQSLTLSQRELGPILCALSPALSLSFLTCEVGTVSLSPCSEEEVWGSSGLKCVRCLDRSPLLRWEPTCLGAGLSTSTPYLKASVILSGPSGASLCSPDKEQTVPGAQAPWLFPICANFVLPPGLCAAPVPFLLGLVNSHSPLHSVQLPLLEEAHINLRLGWVQCRLALTVLPALLVTPVTAVISCLGTTAWLLTPHAMTVYPMRVGTLSRSQLHRQHPTQCLHIADAQ